MSQTCMVCASAPGKPSPCSQPTTRTLPPAPPRPHQHDAPQHAAHAHNARKLFLHALSQEPAGSQPSVCSARVSARVRLQPAVLNRSHTPCDASCQPTAQRAWDTHSTSRARRKPYPVATTRSQDKHQHVVPGPLPCWSAVARRQRLPAVQCAGYCSTNSWSAPAQLTRESRRRGARPGVQ